MEKKTNISQDSISKKKKKNDTIWAREDLFLETWESYLLKLFHNFQWQLTKVTEQLLSGNNFIHLFIGCTTPCVGSQLPDQG